MRLAVPGLEREVGLRRDALGHADEYEYDRWNRMIATTIRTGVRFQYEYEENTGKCTKTWGPKGLYAIELRIDQAAKTTYVDGEEPRVITWNEQGVATVASRSDRGFGAVFRPPVKLHSARLSWFPVITLLLYCFCVAVWRANETESAA